MKRSDLDAEVSKAERRAKNGAYSFLVFGENDPDLPAPDGHPWNRKYDPVPVISGRQEALPGSPTLPLDEYIGTGVGLIYGLEDGEEQRPITYEDDLGAFTVEKHAYSHLAWQLAGWEIRASSFEKGKFPPRERYGA